METALFVKTKAELPKNLKKEYEFLLSILEAEDAFREREEEKVEVDNVSFLPKKTVNSKELELVEMFCVMAKIKHLDILLDTERYLRILNKVSDSIAETGCVFQYLEQELHMAACEITKFLSSEEIIDFIRKYDNTVFMDVLDLSIVREDYDSKFYRNGNDMLETAYYEDNLDLQGDESNLDAICLNYVPASDESREY